MIIENRCLLEFKSLESMREFFDFSNKDLRTLIDQKRLTKNFVLGGVKTFKLLPLETKVILAEEELVLWNN